MTVRDDNGPKPAKPAKSGSRDARLAAALRENLRRRKAQERGRDTLPGPDSGTDPASTPPYRENR